MNTRAPNISALASSRGDDAVEEKYITIAEAAELLGVSRSTLWRWIDQGMLSAYRFGQRRVLIRQADLKELISPVREASPARGAEGAGMTELERQRERLGRPLSTQEQKKALAVLEAAERFSTRLRERRGGELFSDSAEILRGMRDERSQELS
jgi:excisionase family DNA binding protein